jgi:pimeloyl-ACP methyl ester carboxylesterase
VARVTDYVTTRSGQGFVRGEGLDRDGVPLVVLHDLPGSACLHEGWLRALGAHRPVLAMDLGGNGHSALAAGESVDVGRWAGEIADLLDAAGYDRAVLYAVGTSAAVAVEAARQAPGRFAAVVLQAPPLVEARWAAAHAADYAPDIAPVRDGSHLLRLWHHLRDQELWYPWFEQTRDHARTTPHRIAPADLQARAVAMLRQPGHYRPIWQAVLAYPLADRLAGLTVPARVAWREADLFARFADRAGTLCGGVAPLLLPEDDGAAAGLVAGMIDVATDGARE